jgi:methylated-DNA-[protein]-cysteine S-methyltransferase
MRGSTAPLYTVFDTPLGGMTVLTISGAVVATQFEDEADEPPLERLEWLAGAPARRSDAELSQVRSEVEGYFAGTLDLFRTPVDLRLAPGGFHRRVLEVTTTIPFGELWTYGDVAEAAGSRRAGRAAGNALGRCPIELFVPCHRVVHAGGSIGGYGRHEDRKRWLIGHETGGKGVRGGPRR